MNRIKLRKLEAIFQNRNIENPPKGFKTRSEWASEWNIGEQHCSRLLKKYIAKDLLEVKNFRAKSGLVVRPIPHYRIKK